MKIEKAELTEIEEALELAWKHLELCQCTGEKSVKAGSEAMIAIGRAIGNIKRGRILK